VGPGATIGTLQTGYPYKKVLSQDKERDVHPRAATLRYRTIPSSQGGLQRCQVSSGSRSRLPAWDGSSVNMCPVTPDPASPMGGLYCFHVSGGSGPRLPAREGSGVATYPGALDPASLLEKVPMLPHVQWLWTPPP
jgi:hypothetical protein